MPQIIIKISFLFSIYIPVSHVEQHLDAFEKTFEKQQRYLGNIGMIFYF
jgi:hypothetical protein